MPQYASEKSAVKSIESCNDRLERDFKGFLSSFLLRWFSVIRNFDVGQRKNVENVDDKFEE